MNAIELLESQHREVETLFSRIQAAKDSKKKEELFTKLADSLAVHAAIEEHHFYPATKWEQTEELLLESLEEHLGVKRVLSDLLEIEVDDETFEAKMKVLKDLVEHHVEEEEGTLFPAAARLLDETELEALGKSMSAEQAKLEQTGSPRASIPAETEKAASI